MLDPKLSGCINHPTVQATYRCKQCGRPVCAACTVSGATGNFCSESCKEKHQAFVERAQAMEQRQRKGPGLGQLRRVLVKLVILLIVVAAAGYAAILFNVPVVAAIARRVLALISGIF